MSALSDLLFDLDAQTTIDREFAAITAPFAWEMPDPRHWIWNGLTATDFFCGMGGSSTGLRGAGYQVKVAANHWPIAIETHSANHPDTEHLCADISSIDLRYLPKTDLLWASPICTEVSPAGGRRKKGDQRDLFEEHGHVSSAAFERTRVTFWEVIRACELHRYSAVLIENVVEAADWELFPTWLAGMVALGYTYQFICVSAAHIGEKDNPHAPQWRDRMYIALVRKGVKMPDLQPRPLAWCYQCEENVHAVQWWKPKRKKHNGRRIGKYGPQYIYVCPEGNHGAVEPYVAPAISAIDWSDLGVRIGDREEHGMRQLKAATLARIEYGLRNLGEPAIVAAHGNTWDGVSGAKNDYVRAWPASSSPLPTQVTETQNGVAMSEPFVTMLRANGRARRLDEPIPTMTTGRNHGLTIPPGAFVMKQYGGHLANRNAVKPVEHPMPSVVGSSSPVLVIPYRKGSKAYPASHGPVSTVATRDQHGVLHASEQLSVDDCNFRMFTPRESATSQRFSRAYTIHGNAGEQQMQAGNAVPVNVAQWLGGGMAQALGGTG